MEREALTGEVPEAWLRLWFPEWDAMPTERQAAIRRATTVARALLWSVQASQRAAPAITSAPVGWLPGRPPQPQ